MQRLGMKIAQLDEEYNQSRIRLGDLQSQIRDLHHSKAKAEQTLQRLRKTASARAKAMYRVGPPGLLIALLESKNANEFSRKVGAASRVGDWESGLAVKLTIANEKVEDKQQDLAGALKTASGVRKSIEARRSQLQGQMNLQKRLLDRLIAETEAARRAAQRSGAARARAAALMELLPAARSVEAPADLPASGSAKTAVQAAYRLTGKPYRWGAAGPDSFDCSGLTMFVWRQAGVSLPHSSRAQYAATRRVSRSDLQPGDLVFFGSPIHHVGMYVGGGNMINSPETGDFVGVRSMNRRDYVGAGRPGV